MADPMIPENLSQEVGKESLDVLPLNEEEMLRALGSNPQMVDVESILFPELAAVDSPQQTDSSYNSSPYSSPNYPESSDRSLMILLLHKPRGSQGMWQEVQNGEGLRVTKGKGKRLKLQIRFPFQINQRGNDAVDVFLIDLVASNPNATKDGFTIEGTFETEDPSIVELEIKLEKYCKKLQFLVTAKAQIGSFKGRSIIFASHNNGKASKIQENGPSLSSDKKRKVGSGDEESVNTVDGNLEVNGFVRARAFLQFSDIRLKTDIADLTDAINIISQLQGKTYFWKNDVPVEGKGGKRVIGLIAQEVQRVLPEVVTEDPETGILAVSYAELVPVLIEAFKQHLQDYADDKQKVHSALEELRTKLEDIESKNKTYRPRISQYPLIFNGYQRRQNPPQYPQVIPPQYSAQQHYPPQAYPPQAYPPQAYPPQAYSPQAYPPQAYPPQAYPPQAYPPQAYPVYNQPFIPSQPPSHVLPKAQEVPPPYQSPPKSHLSHQTQPKLEVQATEVTAIKRNSTSVHWRIMSVVLMVLGVMAIVLSFILLTTIKRRPDEANLWFVALIVGIVLLVIGVIPCLCHRPKKYAFIHQNASHVI